MAAWALLDFPAFCRDMTGCMEVFDGPEGYGIVGEELNRIAGRFEKRLYLSKEASKEWEMIVKPVKEKEFRYMVLNTSLDYFNRSVKLDIDRRQISLCIDSEGFRNRKESPLNLSFEKNMYEPRPDVESAAADELVKSGKQGHGTVWLAKPRKKKGEGQEGPAKERVMAQEVFSHQKPDGLGGEADRIDLLENKWFRILLVLGGIAAIAGAIIWGVRGFSHPKDAAAAEFGRIYTIRETYLRLGPDGSPKA